MVSEVVLMLFLGRLVGGQMDEKARHGWTRRQLMESLLL